MVITKHVFLKYIFSCDVPATSKIINCHRERALRHIDINTCILYVLRHHVQIAKRMRDSIWILEVSVSGFVLRLFCTGHAQCLFGVSKNPFLVLRVVYIVVGMRSVSSSLKRSVSGFEGRLVSMRSLSTESQVIRFGLWCTVILW